MLFKNINDKNLNRAPIDSMSTRRDALRAVLGFAFVAAGGSLLADDAEAANRKKPAKKPRRKTPRKSGPRQPADHVNQINGMPADVSSIVLVLEGDSFRILSEDEPHARRSPASVTKLMTLALLFDEIEAGRLKLDDAITMSATDTGRGGTELGLSPGSKISVQNAILAMVTKSANDVAVSVAEHFSGSEAAFAARMNAKAREIGMANTHFVNSHGMRDSEHYSTAYDLAMLGKYLVQHHADHYHYFSTLSFIFGRQTHGNHNGLMREYEGMDGLKTGMTNHGWQLAASAEKVKPADKEAGMPEIKHRIIGVFLGGITKNQRNNCLGYLMDQGFVTLGHDVPPSKFRYTEMACTSARNGPAPAIAQK